MSGNSVIIDRAWEGVRLQKNRFIGGGYILGGAGNYGHVQLWNPVASGKILVVRRINGNFGSAPNYLAHYNVALATLITTRGNAYIAGPNPVAEIRTRDGSAVGTTIGQFGHNINVDLLREPLIVPAGYGIVALSGVVGVSASAVFEWIEL